MKLLFTLMAASFLLAPMVKAEVNDVACLAQDDGQITLTPSPLLPVRSIVISLPQKSVLGQDYLEQHCRRQVTVKIPAGYQLVRAWAKLHATHPVDFSGRTDLAIMFREQGLTDAATTVTLDAKQKTEVNLRMEAPLAGQSSCRPMLQRTFDFAVDSYLESLNANADVHSGRFSGTLNFLIKPCNT